METPRLRNVLNLYLGDKLTSLRPNTFEKLRENILLDSLDNKIISDKLRRNYDRILALIPINKCNEDLDDASILSNQIAELSKNNIKNYLQIGNLRDNNIKNLINIFKIFEQSGVFSNDG